MTAPTPAAPQTHGVQVIAKILGITPRRVQQLAKEGVFPSAGRGKYPLVACVQAYVKYWQDRAEARAAEPGNGSWDEARTRKVQAEARMVELELAAEEGSLVPLAVHERRVQAIAETLAATIKGLGRYVGEVQRAMTDVEAELLLERVSDELLRACMARADALEDSDALESSAA